LHAINGLVENYFLQKVGKAAEWQSFSELSFLEVISYHFNLFILKKKNKSISTTIRAKRFLNFFFHDLF
jgi:hypothetical protein